LLVHTAILKEVKDSESDAENSNMASCMPRGLIGLLTARIGDLHQNTEAEAHRNEVCDRNSNRGILP
jgi:hypothetical protein